MQQQSTDISVIAREAGEWFEVAYRVEGDSDTRYIRTKDDRPEWVQELVYSAHGNYLPDDWRYEKIQEALEFLAESDDSSYIGEFCDQAVDIYTAARLQWLSSKLDRASYCDEAAEEFGCEGGIIDRIGLGQYAEAAEIFGLVIQALEEVAATREP